MKQRKGITIIITVLNILLIAVCIFFYIRTDRKAPAFSFEKSELIYQEGMQQAVLLDAITAWDDKDGDVTDRIVIEKTVKDEEENSITVFYAVSDSNGNIVKTSRVFPSDFTTVLTTGERGLWTDASLNTSENEIGGSGLGSAGTDRQDDVENRGTSEAGTDTDNSAESKDGEDAEAGESDDEGTAGNRSENTEDDSENEAEKKLEEERKKLEEEAKKLEEEKKQLEEERKQLEEQKRQQTENERQTANTVQSQHSSENQNTAENKSQPAEGNTENAPRDKGQKPVITLKAKEVNTSVGNPPAWVNLIQSLKDDRDDYETLFYSLSVSKYDLSRAGSYPVTLTVTDSDGNVSAPVSLTIHVN